MKKHPVLKEIIRKINDKVAKTLPPDHSSLFDKNCPGGATIQQFCHLFNELSVAHGFTNAATNDVLKLIRDTTSVKIPANEKNSKPHSGPVTSNLVTKYIEEDRKGIVGNVRYFCCFCAFLRL